MRTETDLAGKVALVTGGSSGIGAATARALAGEGMAVAVAARRDAELDAVVAEIRGQGGRAIAVPTDVARWEDCATAVQRTVDELGGLDVLVNGAGVMLMARIENADPQEWVQMMEVNVLGSMFLAKLALPHLLERQGAVVQLSSAAGRVARVNTSGYCASKYAITAFCESLRQEVGDRGVRVIVLEPGSTNTDLRFSITDEEVLAAVSARSATIEQLEADDIADVVVFSLTRHPRVAMNELLFRPTQQNW
ncbi:SDR family NAD(P)-dependent oxidoreductase [Nocardioides humi]|uniref:SDR family NAD(P)-dependent oxidoreductase n=2 Tax=Nocardioides humi TaxID=449461 RepID=A0ABN2A8Q8_9ACTN